MPLTYLTREAVELSVYTIAGQQVATLVRGVRAAGRYRITWDGRSDAGVALASGVYLYRLRVGAQVGDAENAVVALRIF